MLLSLGILGACTKEESYSVSDNTDEEVCVLFYGIGYNNLSSDIKRNVETCAANILPLKGSKKHFLSFTHLTASYNNYSTPTESYLVELSLGSDAEVIRDTLYTISSDRISTDPEVMAEVITKAKEATGANQMGLILSSHGTGWLPEGYYANSNSFTLTSKSFGAEASTASGSLTSEEMTLQDIKDGIPFRLDYIIFDACLMGGIETAYELKDAASKIVFSPAEVLTLGFDYTVMQTLLVDDATPEDFAKAYYDFYTTGAGYSRYGSSSFATITCIETAKMGPLATVCKELFEEYRDALAEVKDSNVQGYYSGSKHWFFDLEDILVEAGISIDECEDLEDALDGCITYKAATPTYIGGTISTYCGLSMYLPAAGSEYLDEYYKDLAWNKATALVK